MQQGFHIGPAVPSAAVHSSSAFGSRAPQSQQQSGMNGIATPSAMVAGSVGAGATSASTGGVDAGAGWYDTLSSVVYNYVKPALLPGALAGLAGMLAYATRQEAYKNNYLKPTLIKNVRYFYRVESLASDMFNLEQLCRQQARNGANTPALLAYVGAAEESLDIVCKWYDLLLRARDSSDQFFRYEVYASNPVHVINVYKNCAEKRFEQIAHGIPAAGQQAFAQIMNSVNTSIHRLTMTAIVISDSFVPL